MAVRVAAQAIPEGTTLEDWTAQTLQNVDKGFRYKPEAQEPLRLGGVPAVLFIDETCRGWFYLHVVCSAREGRLPGVLAVPPWDGGRGPDRLRALPSDVLLHALSSDSGFLGTGWNG